MRKLPVAVVTSIVAHIGAIVWLARDTPVLALTLPPAPVSSKEVPLAEPVAVILLDREAPASTGASTAPRRPTTAPSSSRAAISTTATTATTSTTSTNTTSEPGGEPARSPLMTMRGNEPPPMKGLSTTFVDEFLARSKPLAPPPDIPGERIANEIADLRAQMRRARPEEVAGLRAQIVELNRQRAAEELKPAGGGTFKADKPTFTARVDADGTVHLKDKVAELDRQDKLMLRFGIDPYARNKLAFLDRTRDQRVAVGERHRHQQLGRSTELMQRNIDRLYQRARSLAEQKEGLFELWDDCAESGSADLIAGGAAARALVLGVIRARLRGAAAYTPAELARLNRLRHSQAVFAPYETSEPR